MRYHSKCLFGGRAVRGSGEVQYLEIEFGRYLSKYQCWGK